MRVLLPDRGRRRDGPPGPRPALIQEGAASEDRDTTERLRERVTQRYGALARAALAGDTVTDCGDDSFSAGHYGPGGYPTLDGLPAGAVRASMGCGNPVAVADLHVGEVVLDLGSGGGIDVLHSGRRVGAAGRVYGVDASADMVRLARDNGRVGISDVLARPDLEPAARAEAEGRVGRAVGTLTEHGYRALLRATGFVDITIRATTDAEDGLFSAIVRASKPTSP